VSDNVEKRSDKDIWMDLRTNGVKLKLCFYQSNHVKYIIQRELNNTDVRKLCVYRTLCVHVNSTNCSQAT
jgi:hypothetical protein